MKHNILVTVVIMLSTALAGSSNLLAQAGGRNITLKEAINLSISNSKQLKNSRAKIEEATASLKEAAERRLPEATVSGAYIRLNHPHISLPTKATDSGSGNGSTTQGVGKPSSALYGIANVSLPL